MWIWLNVLLDRLWDLIKPYPPFRWLAEHKRYLNQRELEIQLSEAQDYETWARVATDLDRIEGKIAWKSQPEGDYDHVLIQDRLCELREARERGDIRAVIVALRCGLLRRLGGIHNSMLYSHLRTGTKSVIEEYIAEVDDAIRWLCAADLPDLDFQDKFNLFWETRQSYGRSALLLSGGATLGLYHFGVVKALWDRQLLPRVIAGTSIGSLVAAVLCSRTNDELAALFTQPGQLSFAAFEPGFSLARKMNRLYHKGVLMDVKVLARMMRQNLGDVTFAEAFRRTGRILSITVSSTEHYEFPRLLNYLTSPDVVVWSAAVASCALPLVYQPVQLLRKDSNGKLVPHDASKLRWSDGSLENDLPMHRLSELFNVNHFIVSQINPHVIPFLSSDHHDDASSFLQRLVFLIGSEVRHRMYQLDRLNLLPGPLAQLQPIISQKYQGDITLTPAPITVESYLRLFQNPTYEYLERAMRVGQQHTWSRITEIEMMTRIGFTLEQCVVGLRLAARDALNLHNLAVDSPMLTLHVRSRRWKGNLHGNDESEIERRRRLHGFAKSLPRVADREAERALSIMVDDSEHDRACADAKSAAAVAAAACAGGALDPA